MSTEIRVQPEAKIILDSVSPLGHRLTTMEVRMHRFVLAEFNTHRVFSRNSASSRAIPVSKQIKRIKEDPAMPVEFGSNQAGMQAGPPLEGSVLREAGLAWQDAAESAIAHAERLMKLGVHKQVTNRLLEPFMDHKIIVTATEWDNFFALRANELAQPEIRQAAELMRLIYQDSKPQQLDYEQWHMPYVQEDELVLDVPTLVKVSAARCARVSYLTHDGVRNIDKDLQLFARLTEATPPHASPLEHVARPHDETKDDPFLGNLRGWQQLRHVYWS